MNKITIIIASLSILSLSGCASHAPVQERTEVSSADTDSFDKAKWLDRASTMPGNTMGSK